MKFGKKILSVMLAFTLILGSVFTAPAEKAKAADTDMRAVFSIDAGRKYFSEEQLIQIIDKAAQNGYTDVQILLGNDGLRFFLDDMSINVNGTVYESDDVKSAITAGNDSYYSDPNGNALTEAEMDRITAHAKEKEINVIPGINSPGHMDALLVAMEQLGMTDVRYANGSKVSERTVSLQNDEAVAFVEELVKKYAEYFAGTEVVEIFNFGADEYANDVFGNPGWSYLQSLGLYGKFIDYANAMSAIVKDAGMDPMCFNDGIYYNKQDSFGTFDQDIIISYWTSGWWGFNVAPASYQATKGHRILNTNDGWYWVLGNISSGGYHYNNAITQIGLKDFTQVTGASAGEIPIIGSMQCVWCDNPAMPHDMDRIMSLMDAFAERHAEYMGGENSGEDSGELAPGDDSRDYPKENCTAFADSAYLPGTDTEGPAEYILDDNANTYWHTDWTHGAESPEKLWIGITLDEATELEALRYLPRTSGVGNGLVLGYKVQYRMAETDEWTDIAVGSWSQTVAGWRIAEFDQPVVAKQVRLFGTTTWTDAGNNKHMSAAEIRLRKTPEPEVPEEPEKTTYTVTVDGAVIGDDYLYNTPVTVTAPEAPEGQVFAGWEADGKLISLKEEYTFFVAGDIDLTAKFVEKEVVVEQSAEALLSNVLVTKRDDEKSDIKFVAQLVIPEGYKLVDAGLSWGSKDDIELSLDNEAAKATYIAKISNTNQFSVTIKGVPNDRFVRGRIFAVVEKDGVQIPVIYSIEKKVSAAK